MSKNNEQDSEDLFDSTMGFSEKEPKNKIVWKFNKTEFKFNKFTINIIDFPKINIILNNNSLLFTNKDIIDLIFQFSKLIHEKYRENANKFFEKVFMNEIEFNFQQLLSHETIYGKPQKNKVKKFPFRKKRANYGK